MVNHPFRGKTIINYPQFHHFAGGINLPFPVMGGLCHCFDRINMFIHLLEVQT